MGYNGSNEEHRMNIISSMFVGEIKECRVGIERNGRIMINFILSQHNVNVLGPSLRLQLEGKVEV